MKGLVDTSWLFAASTQLLKFKTSTNVVNHLIIGNLLEKSCSKNFLHPVFMFLFRNSF